MGVKHLPEQTSSSPVILQYYLVQFLCPLNGSLTWLPTASKIYAQEPIYHSSRFFNTPLTRLSSPALTQLTIPRYVIPYLHWLYICHFFFPKCFFCLSHDFLFILFILHNPAHCPLLCTNPLRITLATCRPSQHSILTLIVVAFITCVKIT